MDLLRKSIFLACSPAEAFRLFTDRISDWWPPERRHTRDPNSQLVLSEASGFCERGGDGQTVELGRIRLWDPPHRLLIDFYVGSDAEHPTDLEVRFLPEEGGTRVCITHQPEPRSAQVWAQRAVQFARSWDVVLAALSDASAGGPGSW